MKRAILAMVCGLLTGCTDSERAHKILGAQGYTNIRTTGYELFGCSEDDEVRTGFTATSPGGQPVSGVVCCGLVFKSCTVRVD